MIHTIKIAKQLYKEFMYAYLIEKNISKMLSFVTDDIYYIGTGFLETAHNKEELQTLLQTYILNNPEPFAILYDEITVKENHYGGIYLYVTATLSKEIPNSEVLRMKIRQTVSIVLCSNEYKISMLHTSMASSIQEGEEFYPIQFGKKTMQQLKAEIHIKAFELLNKVIPCGICELQLDDSFTLLYGNDTFYELYGYSPTEMKALLNNQLYKAFHPEDFASNTKVIKNALKKKQTGFEVENRVFRKDGSLIWVFTRGTLTESKNGKVMNCIMLDSTKRKAIEQALRISEERFRIALEQTKNIIFDYNIQTNQVCNFNHPIDVLGFPNKIDNLPYSIIESGVICPESVEEFIHTFEQIRKGTPNTSCIVKTREINGSFCWNQITLTSLFDVDGNPLRCIGVIEDITKQKEMELKYAQEEQYRSAMLSEALFTYEINLSKNQITKGSKKWNKHLGFIVCSNYEKLTETLCKQTVSPDDCKKFMDTFSIENLMLAYRQQISELNLEYEMYSDNGNIIWVSCTMHLLQDPFSSDLKGFLYIKNIDKRKKQELFWRHQAERDSLTNLYNKLSTKNRISDYLQNTQKKAIHAFFFIDIDDFKAINDNLGHVFGDAVLSNIATKIQNTFRKSDIIGRMGGDEYVVFMKDIPSQEHAIKKAKELCQSFRIAFAGNEEICKVSGAVGISFYPAHGTTFEELYEKADKAMYYTKSMGKDQFAVYSDKIKHNTL